MSNYSSIKMELGINAQKIISQSQFYSEQLEKSVSNGIELGLKEIFEQEGGFERFIADAFKEEVESSVRHLANQWQIKNGISEAIQKAVSDKIDQASKEWVNKLFTQAGIEEYLD